MARTVSRARVMWIDSDPVFGGSRSQVQFPAELSGFFGLPRNPALHTAVRRGVIFAGLDYRRKKMDFDHNDVWRINLPTARQGLGGYPGTILVFEKTVRPNLLRLWLVNPGTPVARLLRKTSQRRGKLGSKRREDGTRRRYGFF